MRAALLNTLWDTLASAFAGAQAPLQFGAWQVETRLGEGGTAEVYRARHAESGARAAVKVARDAANESVRERLDAEAAALTAIDHARVVRLLDRGRDGDGAPYLALSVAGDEDLQALIDRRGPMDCTDVVEVLVQLADALAAVHAAGFVHRDLKPGNVAVSRERGALRATLLDFGLAAPRGSAADPELIVGTPAFMAPEQVTMPQDVDPSSDLYALGALAFYLLTARRVFPKRRMIELFSDLLHDEAPSVAAVAAQPIPPALDRLIGQLLERDPLRRPPSAAVVAARLRCLQYAGCADAPADCAPLLAAA